MFGDKHNCAYFNSIDEMLAAVKNIDIVSVCSPNGLHAEHSIKALNAGFSVLCEKPMATSSRDCERMMQTAEKANKRLFVIKQNRFNPPLAKRYRLMYIYRANAKYETYDQMPVGYSNTYCSFSLQRKSTNAGAGRENIPNSKDR